MTSAQIDLSLMPYPAGRDNVEGTCFFHMLTQQVEALLNRYTDDLAVKRVMYIEDQPVVVPVPRIGLSPTSIAWNVFTWVGTKSGDPDLGSNVKGPPEGTAAMPFFLEAYWPARERVWNTWVGRDSLLDPGSRGIAALQRCAEKGWWFSGFCSGQGNPPPGAYRNYSQMAAAFGGNALEDVPWSLGNYYFDLVRTDIPFGDRNAAIQRVMNELDLGLPVFLGFSSGTKRSINDGNGGLFKMFGEVSWYLPPEMGGCTLGQLHAALEFKNGHAVNLVGYAVSGSRTAPNLYNSYFVIENNWGKNAGYRSFNFISFAAFKLLVSELAIYRLRHTCWSEACASKPSLREYQPETLQKLQFPPDPGKAGLARAYNKMIGDMEVILGGVPTELEDMVKFKRSPFTKLFMQELRKKKK